MLGDIPMNVVRRELAALIDKAEAERKWLWCHYQDLWFSPSQLRAANAEGKFVWGAVNFKLRDPEERIEEANRRASLANAEAAKIEREVRASQSNS